MLKRIAIGVVLALLVALLAWAQDYKKGLPAAKRSNDATAFKEWRHLAAPMVHYSYQTIDDALAKLRGFMAAVFKSQETFWRYLAAGWEKPS